MSVLIDDVSASASHVKQAVSGLLLSVQAWTSSHQAWYFISNKHVLIAFRPCLWIESGFSITGWSSGYSSIKYRTRFSRPLISYARSWATGSEPAGHRLAGFEGRLYHRGAWFLIFLVKLAWLVLVWQHWSYKLPSKLSICKFDTMLLFETFMI